MGWEVGVGDDRGLTHVRQAWGANFEARFPCPPPSPPCPPSVSASTPNKTAGRGRNQGGYLPTYRAVVSLGSLSLHVSALRLARSKQK